VGRDYGALGHTGRETAVRMAGFGSVEDSLGCSPLRIHAVVVAGLRHRGCIRSPDCGLGPARSSPDLT
jgi:hypothetical protein